VREFSGGDETPRVSKWLEMIADPVRLGILRSLSSVGDATTADLTSSGQASNQTLRRHLEALVALGVIEEHPPRSNGETPGRPAARYSLPAAMRESVRSVFEPPEFASPRPATAMAQRAGGSSRRALASTRLIAAAGPMNGATAR
jgi:DNA-binding HxlR family transcriptional regulator